MTPDVLARRSARRVKELLPGAVRDVVIGSPLMTELIERGGGAALIVHCVAEMSAADAGRAIEAAARKSGWTETPFDPVKAGNAADAQERVPPVKFSWTKQNLTFHFETVSRPDGAGCDVDYRFTDDEAYTLRKGKENNED